MFNPFADLSRIHFVGEEHFRGPGICKQTGVVHLMRLGDRKRQQHGRPARRADLGQSDRSGAGDEQVTICHGARNVIQERHDFHLISDACSRIGRPSLFQVAGPGLMEDSHSGQPLCRFGHGLVDLFRALAAAEHEKTRRIHDR